MSEPAPTDTSGLWTGLVLAAPFLAYATRGVVMDLPGGQLTSFLRFFIGAPLVHDLLVAPAAGALAWLVAQRAPRMAVGPVHAAMLSSAVTALVAWPFLRGYGTTSGEPSFLSRNYATSLLVVWAAVWTLAAVAIGWRMVTARRR